jgi:uncharacterized protein DUF4259
MGAWGAGSFDNDDAMDWVVGLAEGSVDNVLRQALAPVASTGDRYLEAPDCSIAIAAAEAVAAARGHPAASLPEDLANWVAKKPTVATDLVGLARAAVDRVVSKSELKDLWDESDSPDDWRAAVNELRKRLD